jgi:riboflavin kinase/FMN adenylyltransferase
VLLVREELRRGIPPGESAITLGVFDGVHRGHRALVEWLRAEAQARQLTPGVVTFHPSPISVLRPDIPLAYLESLERRVELLKELGAEFVAVVSFTSELAQVSAEEFVRLLVHEARARLLVIGADFALGRGREGTAERLAELGAPLGLEIIPFELVAADEAKVSSTRIRRGLAQGEMEDVARLLGRPYSLRGPVLRGEERGRLLGFPTLNIGVSPDRALPPNGVYVTRADAGEQRFGAVTNIGVRPTFDGSSRQVETHLLDFEGDLYGAHVSIELLHRLRAEQRFANPEALVAQIRADAAASRDYLAQVAHT